MKRRGGVAALALLAVQPCGAAEIGIPDGSVVTVTGQIREGDARALAAVLGTLGPARPTVVLESPGGDAAESVRLAHVVRLHGADTVVADGSRCASACFVVFAAGVRRMLGPGSELAVHGAVEVDGSITPRILEVDAAMRRASASYGVPPSVTRRMSVAYGRDLYVLGPGDLRAMGVVVVAGRRRASPGGDVRTLLGPTLR